MKMPVIAERDTILTKVLDFVFYLKIAVSIKFSGTEKKFMDLKIVK